MLQKLLPRLPARGLLAVAVYLSCVVLLSTAIALSVPRVDLQLGAYQGSVRVLSTDSGVGMPPPGARVLALSTPDRTTVVRLQPEDLIDEPDLLPDYADMEAFFTRQSSIAKILGRRSIILAWTGNDGVGLRETILVPSAGSLWLLPFQYWFQVLCCSLGCLVAAWVWVLRPDDWGVRLFGLTGLLFPLFVLPAAIYTTRGIALDAGTFRFLSAMNHGASALFGAATVAIFMAYPRPLVAPKHLLWPFVVFGLWWVGDVTRLAPSLDWGTRVAVLTELALSIGLFALQWYRVRGNPLERASLAWLAISLLAGSAVFLLATVVPASLGLSGPIPEGYAFGFFLLIYVGIALGLRRHRLFDLDIWAYRLLLWFLAALAVMLLDAMLIALLGWSDALALGVSIWMAALLYMPARNWLWNRITRTSVMTLEAALPEIIKIAFIAAARTREEEWESLMRRTFAPLQFDTCPLKPSPAGGARVIEDGLALQVPACAGLAPCILRYADNGRRLFRTADADLVGNFCNLMERAEAARREQEQGVLQERRRIARDMHDDIGARLLMLIHSAVTPQQADTARAAMEELRAALAALDRQPAPLEEAVADWRAEASQRCEAMGVELRWETSGDPEGVWIDSARRAVFDRVVRECLTNAFKHGSPLSIDVSLRIGAGRIELEIANDGARLESSNWREGRGLRGLRERLESLGGRFELPSGKDGTVVVRVSA